MGLEYCTHQGDAGKISFAVNSVASGCFGVRFGQKLDSLIKIPF